MKNYNDTCVNLLRSLSAEMITNANSGHTGVALGAAPIFYALFKDHYFFDVKDENLIARDRLVVSAGHASSLYYATAFMFNFDIEENDLKNFRKFASKTPGHPEINRTSFVETSTGPLGQGVANAVGMAIGQSMLGARFNAQKYPVIDNYTYCFAGDGCLMEGVATEALSLAGTLALNKFILLYDCNKITIDGNRDIANAENVSKKFKAMGYNVVNVKNANDYNCCTKGIYKAKSYKTKPTIVIFNTTIGFGSQKAGMPQIHGTPLSNSELSLLKKELGVKTSFCLPKDVKEYISKCIVKHKEKVKEYNKNLILYEKTNPDLYKNFEEFMQNQDVDMFKLVSNDILDLQKAGRDINANLLNILAKSLVRFVGGSADLAASTKAYLIDGGNYSKNNRKGKNIAFGIREHSMGAICNGLALYLKTPVFCSTFLAFSNYMYPAIRMSALMSLPVMYMFTHDSYKVGEDGPTHQSVEQLGALRLLPNLNVFRPANVEELCVCYNIALKEQKPSAFVICKQEFAKRFDNVKNIEKGGYSVYGKSGDVLIMASGSEVELALKVAEVLSSQDISVCVASFPCLNVFDNQSAAYKDKVLNCCKHRIAIEASNDNIWYKYIDKKDSFVCIDKFGESANSADLDKHYKFTVADVCKKVKAVIGK